MTNLEALKANISQIHGLVLSDNAFAKALVDEAITGTDVYSKENEQIIDLATIRVYKQILASADFSEGGVSYKQNPEIKLAILNLQCKWGILPDMSPTVTGVRPW